MSETMGERIRRLRRTREWTQYDLAAEVGTVRWTIGRWENSATEPSISRLARLCDALDTSADYLIGRRAS